MCQRCLTRDTVAAQLEAVHSFSADHYEMMCNGLLDAVANSTIAHSGHRRAAERFFKHADLCVELAPVEPLTLPPRRWWTPWAEMAARNRDSLYIIGAWLGGFLVGRLH